MQVSTSKAYNDLFCSGAIIFTSSYVLFALPIVIYKILFVKYVLH